MLGTHRIRVRSPRPKRPRTPSLAMISFAAATDKMRRCSRRQRALSKKEGGGGRTIADVALVRLPIRLEDAQRV